VRLQLSARVQVLHGDAVAEDGASAMSRR